MRVFYSLFFPFIRFCIKVCMHSSFAEHRNKTKDLLAWRPGLSSDGWCRSVPFSKSRSPSLCRKYSCTLTSSSKLHVACCTGVLYWLLFYCQIIFGYRNYVAVKWMVFAVKGNIYITANSNVHQFLYMIHTYIYI